MTISLDLPVFLQKPDTISASQPLRVLVVDDNVKIHDDFAKILCPRVATPSLDAAEADLFGTPRPKETKAALTFQIDYAHRGEDGLGLVRRSLESDAPY